MRSVVIGSRGSALALTQTRAIAAQIEALGVQVRIEIISTTGDRVLDAPLARIGGKGLFTKEIEEALLDRRIDAAVHSMKDLPTVLPEGLVLAAVPRRELPNDVLVSAHWPSLAQLPRGARVGTSSLRRTAQLRLYRNDLEIVDLRGNIDTRLRRVEEGAIDAAILAFAGLQRLARADAVTERIATDIMVPAVGQGALAIETRGDDTVLLELLAQLHDTPTAAETAAERALLEEIGGGCQVPLGALGRAQARTLTLTACVCQLDGTRVIRHEESGDMGSPAELGRRVAGKLIAAGADAIVRDAHDQTLGTS